MDLNGRPIRKEHDGGVVAELTYTPGGLLDTETLKSSTGTVIGVATYVYDDLGRVASTVTAQPSMKEVAAEYAYGCDAAGQVARADVLHPEAAVTVVPDGQGRVRGRGGGSAVREHAGGAADGEPRRRFQRGPGAARGPFAADAPRITVPVPWPGRRRARDCPLRRGQFMQGGAGPGPSHERPSRRPVQTDGSNERGGGLASTVFELPRQPRGVHGTLRAPITSPR
ncbi:MAG TPA: hypothetical protein VEJ18_11645 [Planctomycetota bacterium]|nr:hypothetical protein [Planctomycetota bacterium]